MRSFPASSRKRPDVRFLAAALLVSAVACNRPAQEPDAPVPLTPNTLSEAEIRAGWRLLFDGETPGGWRGVHQADFPRDRWVVQDGTLMVVGEEAGFSSIITEEQFSSVELSLEFKIQEGANGGIKYFVVEGEPPTPGRGLGLEYQIWDDHRNIKIRAL